MIGNMKKPQQLHRFLLKPKDDRVQRLNVPERDEILIVEEVERIISFAEHRRCLIAYFGNLILFSTERGDAWLIDPKRKYALCLALAGKRQKFEVSDKDKKYMIAWTSDFYIISNKFVVTDDKTKRIKTYYGYPTKELTGFIKRKL